MADTPTPNAAAETRPLRTAATVVVMRDSPSGIEVLLLRRAERGDHSSGAWVFPGGVLDAQDRDCAAFCGTLDDAAASASMGMTQGGLDYYVAAIRECFEEAGLLLACGADGHLLSLAGEMGTEMGPWRSRLHRGEATMAQFCSHFGLTLATDRLAYFSRWVTPAIRAKRWDTRFFFAIAPTEQESAHDEVELVEQLWLTPADAIARSESLKLLNPTRYTLETLSGFATTAEMMAHARTPRTVAMPVPRIADGPEGMHPVAADHFAWAEVGKLDPQGHGTASYAIVPGRAVRLSDRVIRVSADNSGMMTGPGTNTYLVGGGPRNEWAVIDPGPSLAPHVEAILKAAPGPIRWILVTHTHQDHSPAANELRERTGAQVLGRIASYPQNQDPAFKPDRILAHGERLAIDQDTTLAVFHTPGHASNHLCYLLEQERMLFTGDHVMQTSTVVIGPPDGDMTAYLDSLRALLKVELSWFAPGHGFLMAQPHKALEGIVAHRLRREAKVLEAVTELAGADTDALLARVYDDVKPGLHPVARRSLTAHLQKLVADGRVRQENDRWSAIG
jgi:glyoxylase-like metal-dependent hydrolase (beta-lactamase superfamily II)/8-oxo-dGTP pyrophosphatase MutT (NUDIX family)